VSQFRGRRHTGAIRSLVLHSPLVGPSTVTRLATALEAKGWTTTVPDLRDALDSPVGFASRAVERSDSVEVVIGHSGAGAVLPVVADRTAAVATIFIDAVVPEAGERFTPSKRFTELLDDVPTTDGLLAPWHHWWPAETMADLLPDETVREEVVAEIPRVPRSFYEHSFALPPTWWTRPTAFVQLSPAYDEDRTRAERLGWPVHRLDGQHLDLVVHPDLVADHVTELAAVIADTTA
jgi:hypothetical protein